ncbi:MAG TPA: mechanosensitive ion channel domain-containing protein [Bacilli bacterium]|nr:mechanosensitive ion channel domain-containing protein [Bacilli bacterium]
MNLINQLREVLTNLLSTFITNESLVALLVSLAMILLWILIAILTIFIVKKIVFRGKKLEEKLGRKETKEQETVKRLIVNIIQFFFFFWIGIMILRELGLDIVPILAGAGVVAFAIGFGAQELIKDIIAGMFLIGEKTFKIGDYVEIANHTGTITDVGVRRIKLQTWKGEVITINNGDIRAIKNFSINPGVAVVEFRADYDFDFKVLESKKFKKLLKDFQEKHEDVISIDEHIKLLDVNDGLKFVIHIKTNIRKYTGIERYFRKALMEFFQQEKIDVVVPVVISEQTKN